MPGKYTGDDALTGLRFERAARRYLKRLTPEHFMESTAQATQRAITVASLELVSRARPDVQVFSELLIQYPKGNGDRLGQVVPDDFVVVHPDMARARTCFNLPRERGRPLVVMEYVSPSNPRKDNDFNMRRYAEVGVPYYLLFAPEALELTLFRLADGRYKLIPPSPAGRVAVPELELEAGLIGDWVRYWFRGELLPVPTELADQLDAAREQARRAEQQLRAATQEYQAGERELGATVGRLRQTEQQLEATAERLQASEQALAAALAELARLQGAG